MDEKQKEQLMSMVDNSINGNKEQAELDFHGYLQTKMQQTLGLDVDTADQETSDES